MPLRFSDAEARPVILACSQAMSAIGTLDALADERNAALAALHAHVVDVAGRVGAVVPPITSLEGAASGARAVADASREQRHALRATLADVIVDAQAARPDNAGLDEAIDVATAAIAPAPRGPSTTGLEAPDLLRLHADLREWAGAHFGQALDSLTEGLTTLRELIGERETADFVELTGTVERALARLSPDAP